MAGIFPTKISAENSRFFVQAIFVILWKTWGFCFLILIASWSVAIVEKTHGLPFISTEQYQLYPVVFGEILGPQLADPEDPEIHFGIPLHP